MQKCLTEIFCDNAYRNIISSVLNLPQMLLQIHFFLGGQWSYSDFCPVFSLLLPLVKLKIYWHAMEITAVLFYWTSPKPIKSVFMAEVQKSPTQIRLKKLQHPQLVSVKRNTHFNPGREIKHALMSTKRIPLMSDNSAVNFIVSFPFFLSILECDFMQRNTPANLIPLQLFYFFFLFCFWIRKFPYYFGTFFLFGSEEHILSLLKAVKATLQHFLECTRLFRERYIWIDTTIVNTAKTPSFSYDRVNSLSDTCTLGI